MGREDDTCTIYIEHPPLTERSKMPLKVNWVIPHDYRGLYLGMRIRDPDRDPDWWNWSNGPTEIVNGMETTDGGNLELGEMMDMEVPVPSDTTTQTNPTDDTTTQTPTQNTTNTNTDASTPQVAQAQSSQSPDGIKKWKCRWCGKLYTYDAKWKSTSNGKKHLDACIQRRIMLKGNNEKEFAQSRLNIGDNTPSLATWTYNHARVREIAAHMILGHEFPFSVMEGVIFNEFLKEIYPWCKNITRQQVMFDCETFYEAERIKMKRSMALINRVSLTTDLQWSGEQRIGYMTVTGHFIDSKWQLHKRVLSFKNVPSPYSGEVLCRVLIKVMDDWGIRDKVASISVDNTSANDKCIARLKRDYSGRRNLPLDGKLFHVRCCAHILNLLVQDGLNMIKVYVDKIRNGVKYLLNSETRCKSFKKIVDELQLEGRMQVLDTKTRWNSTWLMLSTAYHYREVWPRYAEENGAFLSFLPDANDWEDVHDICKFLEVFADVTSIISGTSYPTANLFLSELYRVKVLLNNPSSISHNPQLQALASEVKLKYDKYWSESNTLISIGAVLDPSCLAAGCGLIAYDGTNDATTHTAASESPEVGSTSGLGRRNFEMFLETVVGNNFKTDLELYFEESPLKVLPNAKFDVLTWWVGNEAKYPVLSKLAKDILTVPVTTVALEATFSAGKRIINPKRSSMKTKTVEMVLCGGDWVKEKYGIKKGCTASILEEPQDEPLTYHFDEDLGVSSTAAAT
ncbi:zinc finger BED domain-containing protein RICESLEEPER 2-like [Vicia villosa]|uniref:zinc finger BED domain-containing protein RICESLEEPER 2-like n=1 Tax=Vicia villosa TaxID=3911 RepID=UPI00273AAC6B|nr:zinc finger BED domain-containing protein RICESLEEPER 2-like [Vicia villosa]